ncbi:hypothetical protein [Acidomonas methanolica]|uniref:Uncharacterized protein n=1 Tax=Acidomonas methanolica NBRC 104435 TaxID=1231351 RepID=A0A023D428_ACIMT|nr:hypothetical protein [Acidomonas methanolica]MBU2654742.1 hypothetical protein [Acidomonas methanolica]TCS26402.1 hypothetical protein EDC31_11444 [Acidomonas methanolica]GAJ28525.1 hypothetical protein Amme_030_025 [Acidomonas methanolica NBRC 104435]GBQ50530.1 hypothetical protein AA0498_1236 [Acidomonas methanolica]GEK99759.1 hypothetical protein AME01nite_22580 [Acidomonas methanolica NBRC 104435]
MYIAPFDHYAPPGALHLIWSLTGRSADDILALVSQFHQGAAVLVDPEALPALRAAAPKLRIFLRDGDSIVRLSAEGRAMDRFHLSANKLPSQMAATRGQTSGEQEAVALDIVMGETTDEAWERMEALTEAGLPAGVAASALVGTPTEVARRLEDYRMEHVRHIVLTAPPERAPYEMVRRDLVPLLTRRPTAGSPAPLPDRVETDAITWHGVAL